MAKATFIFGAEKGEDKLRTPYMHMVFVSCKKTDSARNVQLELIVNIPLAIGSK